MASREERVDDLATEDVDTLVEIIIAAEEERDRLLSVGFPREPKQAGGWTIQYNFLEDVKVAIEKESPDYVPSMEEIEAVLLVVEHLTTAST